MENSELLKLQADTSYKELLDSIAEVSEPLAWARIELQPGEYLHSEGSILSLVAHVAGCKFIYGSAGYRNLEIRWRDIVARLEKIWPSWEGFKAYLQEAQDYWIASWAGEVDFEREVKDFRDRLRPSWKMICTVTHHDAYHAGQIQVLRSVLRPSQVPPPDESEQWRKDCGDLPSW